MEIDAYFDNVKEANEYIKKNSGKIVVVDERKDNDIFGRDRDKCLVEKAKVKCKCKICEDRRFWEAQLLFSEIMLAGLKGIDKAVKDSQSHGNQSKEDSK
jgi:hypothetical protein